MSTFQPIGLGDRAEDPITGLAGIVVCVTKYLGGTIRIGIQPEVIKDGAPAQSCDFDQSQLRLVDAAVHEPMVLSQAFVPHLGDRVKDKITGLAGIVDSETTWLHGCTRYGVRPEALHEGRPVERSYYDQSEIDLVLAAVHKPVELSVAPAPKPETRRSNGGPRRESAGFAR